MRRAGPVLVLLLGGLWLFSSALFGGKVLAGDDLLLFTPPMSEVRPAGLVHPSNELNYDSAYVFHPDLIAARRAIRNWDLPDWTDDIGAGRPMLAAQQAAPLYPTNFPAYVLPFWDSLEWTALLKVLLAAFGMFLFCGALALQRAPALLGAVTFAFSTYFVVWLAHPHTNVYLLLPWLLLAIRTTVHRRTPLATAGLAAVLGLALLAGHPPSLLLVGLLALPYAAFEVAAPSGAAPCRRPDRGRRRSRGRDRRGDDGPAARGARPDDRQQRARRPGAPARRGERVRVPRAVGAARQVRDRRRPFELPGAHRLLRRAADAARPGGVDRAPGAPAGLLRARRRRSGGRGVLAGARRKHRQAARLLQHQHRTLPDPDRVLRRRAGRVRAAAADRGGSPRAPAHGGGHGRGGRRGRPASGSCATRTHGTCSATPSASCRCSATT